MDGNGIKDPNEHWVDIFEHEHYSDLNGNGQWDANEDFDDYNGNGIWDTFDFDTNGDGVWAGPVLVEKAIERDGSYWLTLKCMLTTQIILTDLITGMIFRIHTMDILKSLRQTAIKNIISLAGMRREFLVVATVFSTSTARTNEVRFDLTSQLSSKWNTRVGFDYKVHKLNFYEIKTLGMMAVQSGSALQSTGMTLVKMV